MTDNEIIKALGYCSNVKGPCKDCPFKYEKEYCVLTMTKHALDLIKRQQAEIEELQILTGLMRKRKYYNKFVKEVFQKEKGSNLVYPDADEIYKRYFNQKAEIERLKSHSGKCIYLSDDSITHYCVESICPKFKTEKQIKVEVVEEFAEKLKKSLTGWDSDPTDEEIEYVIDKFLKEMVGANYDR